MKSVIKHGEEIADQKKQLSSNIDDFEYISDNEFIEAPTDPGTYEGGCAKPKNEKEKLNKWCIRECERCAITECDSNEFVRLDDFNTKIKNINQS